MMSKQARKPKTSRSLAATFAMAFVPLSLAAMLIAYLPQFLFFLQARYGGVYSEQQTTAYKAASAVAGFLQEEFSVLETAVSLGDPVSTSQEEQKGVLGRLIGLQPAFRQLVLLDSQEQELAKVSRLSQTASGRLTDRTGGGLLAQIMQGNRYVGPVYFDEVTSEPLVVMAVPAIDVFGDIQGTLMAEVNLKFMWDLVDRLKVGKAGLAYVVDKQGNLIAFGDISRVLRGENLSQLEMVGEFMHNPVPVGEAASRSVRGIADTTVVGTYVPLGLPDWAVVTELPASEAFQPNIQSIMISLLVMLILATLVGLTGVYLARRLTVPLLNLTATTGRIAGGEMDLQAALEGPAEVTSLARAFNSMTAQLRELIGNLEGRVTERTAELSRRTTQLQTSAEVSRDTTMMLEPQELSQRVVSLISERFDYYHAGLFLLDASKTWAVLQAASSEGGQHMLARGHRLRVGEEGIVGYVTGQGQPRVALDVGKDAVFFDNPDLPETRSEIALPLRARGEIIGALDVQSREAAAFTDEDVNVLQVLADQVAVALSNARLFQQVQDTLEVQRRAYDELSQQAWSEILHARPELAFLGSESGIARAADVWRPEMEQALRTGQTVQGDDTNASGQLPLAVPIKIRGEVVGVLDTYKPAEAGDWTSEEIAMLEAIADQLDSALESARLYQDTQRRAAREQAIRQVTERMRRAVDIESILQNTVTELARALDVPRAYVRLGTEAEFGPSGDPMQHISAPAESSQSSEGSQDDA
jgi:GAF domain-containing protein/HAMP domain-containing protein